MLIFEKASSLYSGTGVIRDTNSAGFVWEVYPDLTPPEYLGTRAFRVTVTLTFEWGVSPDLRLYPSTRVFSHPPLASTIHRDIV